MTALRHRLVRSVRRFGGRDNGGTLAEMAIMVPFLAIMLAGVTEFGRFFQTYTTLSKSTRTAARYLSNHPYDATARSKATNLAVCGKLICTGGDELVKNLSSANVCIETTGAPNPVTVAVSIPRTNAGCGQPLIFQPIFDLGLMLHNPAFSLSLPVAPGTTMYYMLDN
jgi:Flp pilus assembly protein TadG